MSRESRMLLILAVFGLGAATVLMAMASRYNKIFEERAKAEAAAEAERPAAVASQGWNRSAKPEPPGRATERSRTLAPEAADSLRRVYGFAEVRRVLKEAIALGVPPVAELEEQHLSDLRAARDEALKRFGVRERDYLDVREHYRAWLAGEKLADDAPAWAIEELRDRLEVVDLGDYERLDL